MGTVNERMRILEMIDKGEISPAEGAAKLDDLGKHDDAPKDAPEIEDRMAILEKIESGEITPEEGAQRLQDYNGGTASHVVIDRHTSPSLDPEEMQKWKRWWTIPLWTGIAVTILAGTWMNSTYNSSGAGFWFFCAWLPLLVGVGLIILGGLSNSSRWLHIRIKQQRDFPSKIAISFPLPIRFTAWILRTFGHFIPGLNDTALDEIILGLDNETKNNPIYINIQDGEDGEQVEVFIG